MLGRASQLADWACTPLLGGSGVTLIWAQKLTYILYTRIEFGLGALPFIHTTRASARVVRVGGVFPQVGLSPLRDTRLWGVSSLLRARPSAGGGLLPYIRAQINGLLV